MDQIRRLSYPQYKNILAGINKKLNWDIHVETITVTGEIQNELNPLYSEEDNDKVFKMSDALVLQNIAKKG